MKVLASSRELFSSISVWIFNDICAGAQLKKKSVGGLFPQSTELFQNSAVTTAIPSDIF